MKPVIRNFTPSDIEQVTAIQEQAVLEGFGSFSIKPLNKSEMLKKLGSLQSDGYPCLVAKIEDKVIGYANVSPHRPRPGYRWTVEDSVYVTPNAHGKGIGYALLDELIKQSETLGFRQMVAVIGDSNNTGSIRLHDKCGFELSGKLKNVGYKNGKWLDVILMQRSLGEADANHPSLVNFPGTLFSD